MRQRRVGFEVAIHSFLEVTSKAQAVSLSSYPELHSEHTLGSGLLVLS